MAKKSGRSRDSKPGLPSFTNRKALRNFNILDRVETGIALAGQEVKSIRAGGLNMGDAYARIRDNEGMLYDLHIAPYKFATYDTLPPTRPRRLLLKKREIRKLKGAVEEKGMTLVPLRVYFKKHLVKVELGLCKGKRQYEKRDTIARKDFEREKERALKERDE